ncbi:MAG: glycosyltransferase family 2 protein [Candidatus Sumerlaeaceae bacterium]|nr:glycosyltransferase family 2 protein [Candidatus Sumerlaeaceae bacterium]
MTSGAMDEKPIGPDAVPLGPGTLRLSVIITNWNTRELLAACLRSLVPYIENPDCEVILVDNGSTDGSPEMASRDFSKVRVLAQKSNLGFGRANNIGIRASRGRYLLILNSDTEVAPGALDLMCDFMDIHPDIGALGARLLNSDGSLQLSCRRFPSYKTVFFHRYSLMTKLFPRNRYSADYLMTETGHDRTMDVDWVSGACLMARRETIEKVGLLDENFFMYAEDVDWCFRIHVGGWRVVYLPEARVTHHIGRSTRQVPGRMTYERHRSMWLFYKKHYSRGIVLLDVATFTGITVRCALMMTKNYIVSLLKGEARS